MLLTVWLLQFNWVHPTSSRLLTAFLNTRDAPLHGSPLLSTLLRALTGPNHLNATYSKVIDMYIVNCPVSTLYTVVISGSSKKCLCFTEPHSDWRGSNHPCLSWRQLITAVQCVGNKSTALQTMNTWNKTLLVYESFDYILLHKEERELTNNMNRKFSIFKSNMNIWRCLSFSPLVARTDFTAPAPVARGRKCPAVSQPPSPSSAFLSPRHSSEWEVLSDFSSTQWRPAGFPEPTNNMLLQAAVTCHVSTLKWRLVLRRLSSTIRPSSSSFWSWHPSR